MTARAVCITAGCMAVLGFAQEVEAPPAIEQWGIANAASHMPMQLPSGGVAPGSLIRIRGWRLGPAGPENVTIRIRRGETRVQGEALSAQENEIEALVPVGAPPGSAMLQVVKNASASLEWPVTIVESSFGAFSRNGQGWGPGEIVNAGGTPNSATHSARPGESVTLAGTGLGAPTNRYRPQVQVAGRLAKSVRVVPRNAARPGVDQLEFALPEDSPEGCYVPVQVSSAPGIYSNAVTIAIDRSGGRCSGTGDWTVAASRPLRMGTVALLQADLLLEPAPKQTVRYPVDAGFASFSEVEPGALASPLFLFPPASTCTAYNGNASLRSIASPLSVLEALPGTPLDAGTAVTVEGAGGTRPLPRDRSPRRNYWAVIGGHSPAPGARELPLFLTPGEYRVSTPGGRDVEAFHTGVRIGQPLVWRNRDQLAEVDRARGASVSWRATGTSSYVLIVAMNVDSRSGALGVCACLANAAAGSFQLPAYALANIPPSPAHPRGFPLNLVLVAELPEMHSLSAAGMSVDRILAFAASISGRSVRFK